MSRPTDLTSWPMTRPSSRASVGSHEAATSMPAGNAVLLKVWTWPSTLVTADEPVQRRMPMGPSAILICGMPRRGTPVLSIQPEPASMATFSSSVMRDNASATLCATGRLAFLYGAEASTPLCANAVTDDIPNDTKPTATQFTRTELSFAGHNRRGNRPLLPVCHATESRWDRVGPGARAAARNRPKLVN
jgi:hypothetical protein